MDLIRKNRYLNKAYKVRTSTFGWAHAVYHNVYHIRSTRSATVYYIRTARSVAAYYIRTARSAVYYIRTARLAVYHIRVARSAVYYNIYYIRVAAATSLYLTSPIYPWLVGIIKEI